MGNGVKAGDKQSEHNNGDGYLRHTWARPPASVLHFHPGFHTLPSQAGFVESGAHTTRRGSLKEGWYMVLHSARTGRASKGQALTTLSKGPHCRTTCIVSTHQILCSEQKCRLYCSDWVVISA